MEGDNEAIIKGNPFTNFDGYFEPTGECQSIRETGCAKCFDLKQYDLERNLPNQVDKIELYRDYARLFDFGLRNQMPQDDVLYGFSDDTELVTANRIPGMCIRMVFHDSAAIRDPSATDKKLESYGEYISDFIDENGVWIGPAKYLEDSGNDASNLLCEQERLHPNNNYDKTASRLLRMFQYPILPAYEDFGNDQVKAVSLMEKYDMVSLITLIALITLIIRIRLALSLSLSLSLALSLFLSNSLCIHMYTYILMTLINLCRAMLMPCLTVELLLIIIFLTARWTP